MITDVQLKKSTMITDVQLLSSLTFLVMLDHYLIYSLKLAYILL
jgi:hypothetical protein